MIQIKEFLNYKDNDKEVNKWIQENYDNIEIINIKYSVSFAQECSSYEGEAISGCLIMYKDLVKQKEIEDKISKERNSPEYISNFYK